MTQYFIALNDDGTPTGAPISLENLKLIDLEIREFAKLNSKYSEADKFLTSSDMSQFGYARFELTEKPIANFQHIKEYVESEPVIDLDKDAFVQVWVEQDKSFDTAEEQQAAMEKTINEIRFNLKEKLSIARLRVECGGLTIDSNTIDTDRPARDAMTSALISMQNGWITTTNWKSFDKWIVWNQAQLESVMQTVLSHVNACFAAEYAVSQSIDAANTIDDLESLDVEALFNAELA